jgi:hypothetical protein
MLEEIQKRVQEITHKEIVKKTFNYLVNKNVIKDSNYSKLVKKTINYKQLISAITYSDLPVLNNEYYQTLDKLESLKQQRKEIKKLNYL